MYTLYIGIKYYNKRSLHKKHLRERERIYYSRQKQSGLNNLTQKGYRISHLCTDYIY